ncbi:MAG TPA: hypothetical protein ENH85_07250 [Candidatus Scalindua sp.]|nr:hypothetical protein [Candidatus Scalindua sp.]
MEIIYTRRKPKSVEGKGWVFLQEFWKSMVLYLLEKEVNRLIGKRFYKSKKEKFEKLYKVLRESKGFNLDEKIVEELRKLNTPIAQELLENSIYHLYKLLDTIPITEVDRPQDIGSVLIERRWNKWESSIRDISRYPPAPDVKNKLSPIYWRKYFNNLDQKLTNFFFENLIINYETLISEEDVNQLRRKAVLGYIEILRGFIIDHPKWVFKSNYSSGIVEKLASVNLEGCWIGSSDIILTSPIGDYEENISIVLGKYLQRKGIPVSNQVISQAMKLWPHYQFPGYYLGWIKDERVEGIFLKSVRRTLINFPAGAKEEIRNFLDGLREKEKKWMVIIPIEGFQSLAGMINFEDLFLKFTTSIDFLNGKIETRFIDILKNYKGFVVIDQVSAMDPNMARYIACKTGRRVLDLLSFLLDSPLVIDPNPLSCVISKEGGNKTGATFLLGGDIPKLECWKRPQNTDLILQLDKLIIYSGNKDKKNEEKIRRALRWLNKSLSETENEVKFLELWIPFELLGGGSYHYKDNIPKILAEKYISRRWSSLTIKQRYQTIYQEREQIREIVDFLAEIRSSLLIHRGEIDLPQLNYSVEQLHSIMRFLINEIFAYLNYKFNKKETVSDLTKEMIRKIDQVRDLRG